MASFSERPYERHNTLGSHLIGLLVFWSVFSRDVVQKTKVLERSAPGSRLE